MLQHIMYLMFGLIFWHAVLLNFNVSIYFSTINISQQFLSFYNVFSAFGRYGFKKNYSQWQWMALVATHDISNAIALMVTIGALVTIQHWRPFSGDMLSLKVLRRQCGSFTAKSVDTKDHYSCIVSYTQTIYVISSILYNRNISVILSQMRIIFVILLHMNHL